MTYASWFVGKTKHFWDNYTVFGEGISVDKIIDLCSCRKATNMRRIPLLKDCNWCVRVIGNERKKSSSSMMLDSATISFRGEAVYANVVNSRQKRNSSGVNAKYCSSTGCLTYALEERLATGGNVVGSHGHSLLALRALTLRCRSSLLSRILYATNLRINGETSSYIIC